MPTKIKDKQVEVTADYSAESAPTESGVRENDLHGFAAWVAKSIRWLKNNYLPLSGGRMTGTLTLKDYNTPSVRVKNWGRIATGADYADWSAEDKAKKFRAVKIIFPRYAINQHVSSVWFQLNFAVRFRTSYNAYNSFGYNEYRYDWQFSVSTDSNRNITVYKANHKVVHANTDEFVPLAPQYNEETDSVEVWIISTKPRSNNHMWDFEVAMNSSTVGEGYTVRQGMELVDNDGYFPVSSPTVKVPFPTTTETKGAYYEDVSHHDINFDADIEPNQTGTVRKDLRWMLQYLTQGVQWVKRRDAAARYKGLRYPKKGVLAELPLVNGMYLIHIVSKKYSGDAQHVDSHINVYIYKEGGEWKINRYVSAYNRWAALSGKVVITTQQKVYVWLDWSDNGFNLWNSVLVKAVDTYRGGDAFVAGNNKVISLADAACPLDVAVSVDIVNINSFHELNFNPAEKADTNHTHDTLYATKSHTHNYAAMHHAHAWGDISGKPSVYPPAMHTHTEYVQALVSSGGEAIVPNNGVMSIAAGDSNVWVGKSGNGAFSLKATPLWDEIQNLPDAFPPMEHAHMEYAAATHTHGMAGITGLQQALNGKADIHHEHEWTSISGVQQNTNTFNMLENATPNFYFNYRKKDGQPVPQADKINTVHVNDGTGTMNYASIKAKEFIDARKSFFSRVVTAPFDVGSFYADFLGYRCVELMVDVYNGNSYGGLRPPLDVGNKSCKIYMHSAGFPVDTERETVVCIRIYNGNVSGELVVEGTGNDNTIFSGDKVYPFNTLNGNNKPIGFFITKVIGGKKFMRGYKVID